MKLVVTGGCGFIGLNVIRRLADMKLAEIRLLDNLSNSTTDALVSLMREVGEVVEDNSLGDHGWRFTVDGHETLVSLRVADIMDAEAAVGVCDGADAVIHLAAQTGVDISLEQPRDDVRINVVGTHNILEACRLGGVKRFVVASSLAVIGDAPAPQREDALFQPISPYAAAKAAIEGYCSAYYQSFGLKTVALRFANVYGPYCWRKGSVVAKFCKRALAGESLVVEGDGLQTRDFIHSADLAEVIVTAAAGDDALLKFGSAVNVATGVSTTVKELATEIQTQFAKVGQEVALETGAGRPVDVRISSPATERLRTMMPQITMRPLSQGLEETIAWAKANLT